MTISLARRLLTPLLVLSLVLFTPMVVFGGDSIDPDFRNNACDGITGDGVGDCGDASFVTTLVSNVLNILSFVVGAAAVITIIIGGLRFITANGDPQGTATARQMIIYSVIGLIVALAAQGIVQFVLEEV